MGGSQSCKCSCEDHTDIKPYNEGLIAVPNVFARGQELAPTVINPAPTTYACDIALKFKQTPENGVVEIRFKSRPIGLRIGRDRKDLPITVKAVYPDGIAETRGIQKGWELLEVNGSAVSKMDPWDVETCALGPLDKCTINARSLLDFFDDFRSQVPTLKLYLERHSDFEAKARALARQASKGPNQEDIPEILADVVTNLNAVEPLSANVVKALQLVLKHIDKWKFETNGGCDAPPELSDAQDCKLEMSLADLNKIHALSYISYPPKFLNYSTFLGLTGQLFRDLPRSDQPTAVITVGGPGSGKSFIISSKNGCCTYLKNEFQTPPLESYVEIDPDNWIGRLCDNDNAYRPLCNMLNLENFFLALNQRYNIIFGGTGKDVKNTVGRVTARLKQANYRIFYAIVLTNYEKSTSRIRDRFLKTGRDVPDNAVRGMFKSLQDSVPTYLRNQANLAEAMLIYENNDYGRFPDPFILSGGDDPTQAIDLVNKILELPPVPEKGGA